jgi:hypothetical protein
MLRKAILLVTSTLPLLAQKADSIAIETRLEQLQSRLNRIESVRAIKRLQQAYGHYVEFGLWNDFADLFTDDAITNYQQGARGKAEVRKLFFDQVGQGRLGLADGRIYPHILFQPVITLAPDGRTAKGRWRILAMLGGYGGSATWYSGVYENEYVLQDGVWKISVLRSEPKATAAYTAPGWKDSGVHVPFHYKAADLTTPISVDAKTASNATPSFTSLTEGANQLAPRVERLNDQAAVTNLQDTYGYAFDRKQWDQVASLFAADGTLELGQQGVYVGKASIRKGLNAFGPQGLREGERNDHVYLQTVVSVAPDHRTANARGVELIFSSANGGELREGVFENAFIKQNNSWKIQSVHFYPRMIVDAASGWAKSAKPASGPSKEFPPDRPPTATYEIYPKFTVAPFHFDNPVTGMPPQYPAGVSPAAKPTIAAASPAGSAIRDIRELTTRLTELERAVTSAETYDAGENLIGAYGYYLDESPSDAAALFVRKDLAPSQLAVDGKIFANQILQPVIDIAPDAKSAKIRARLLGLNGTSGAKGYWTSGLLEGQIVSEQGSWKFQTANWSLRWTAPYPGGWGREP